MILSLRPSIIPSKRLFLAAACLALAGCDFAYDETLGGCYRLVAADREEDMMLCRSIGDDCSGDELPAPTVFAAGINAKYVDIARHPQPAQGGEDRRITEYYYIIRTPDEATNFAIGKNVRGPFDQPTFNQEKAALGLPDFSRTFDDLK